MSHSRRRPAVIALMGSFITLIIALSGITMVDLVVRRIVLQDLRNYLTRTVTATADLIDGDEYLKFVSPDQDTTEAYRKASRPLRVLMETNPDIRFAYSGITVGPKMRFVLDGSPLDARDAAGKAEHARPMEEDIASPGEVEVTSTQRPTVEQQPSATAWGMGIRAQAPIFQSNGRMAGYVGITMRADRYEYLVRRADIAAIWGAVIVTSLAFITGVGIWRTQRAREDAEHARDQSEAQLARERDRLRDYAQALDRAEIGMRRATATQLHEGISQILAGQSLILGAASVRTDAVALRTLIDQASEASREAQSSIRTMIEDISPPELEQATLDEMAAWLRKLFAERYGFKISVRVSGDVGLPPREQCQLIYRIVRELIYNVYQHSQMDEAELEISVIEDVIEVQVNDRGVGFQARKGSILPTGTFGLAHIAERVRAAGGTFQLDAQPGEGCRASLRLPIAAAVTATGSSSA